MKDVKCDMKKQANRKKNGIRPSPNEVATIIQSEQERRKKIRLKQVREQEREFARKVRQNIKKKRNTELKILSDELKKEWTEKQLEEQKTLEEKYQKNLSTFGEGHAGAVVDQNIEKKDGRILTKEEKQRAIERHNEAMHQLLLQKEKDQEAQRNLLEARAKAIEAEKERAAMIASLPPPQNIVLEFELSGDPTGQPKKIDDFKSTHFHLQKPLVQVERMDRDIQPDARYEAMVAETRIKEIVDDNQRNQSEQVEKALLRHKHALGKLRIEEDHKKLMDELGELERMDRQRRQQAVAKIPVRIFQPPHKRVEDAEERQRDLEQAFEDMYMLQTGYTGDLTIALEPSTDQVIIPEQHQFLVPDQRPEEQPEPSVPPSDQDQADAKAVPIQSDDEHDIVMEREEDDGSTVEVEDKSSIPPKGEDAVKRLLQRIQKQREQANEVRPTEKATEKVDRTRKIPLVPLRTAAHPSGPKVNVMTPLPEEDEQHLDEDTPRSHFPTFHPMEAKPSTGSPVRGADNIREARTLLHPNEAARQARAGFTRDEEDRDDTSRETTLSPPTKEEEIQKERLTRQLEEQRLIQQRLEDQLKEYQRKIEELDSEKRHAPFKVPEIPQGPPDDVREENTAVPYDKSTAKPTETYDHIDETASRTYDTDAGRLMAPTDGGTTRHLAPFVNGATRPYVGEPMQSVETGGDSVTEADEDLKRSPQFSSDMRGDVGQKDGGFSSPSLESGSLSEEHVADEIETEETSSSSSDGWPKPKQPYSHVPTQQNMTGDSSRPAFTTGAVHTFQKLPQERSSFAFETTIESFPRESSSDSEAKLDSEDVSSTSGSADLKHEGGPTTCHFTQEVVHSLPSSTLSSVGADSFRSRFSSLTSMSASAPSRKASDQITESLYSSPFQSITEVSSYQGPRLTTSGLIHATPSPVAFKTATLAPKAPVGTPNYLEEYRRKWEEEKKLIENQRHLLKQKQEQQLRRMRYYQDILDKHEKSDSPGAVYSAPIKEFSAIPITSRYEGASAPLLPSQKEQLQSKFGQDLAVVHSDDTSRDISIKNKENENVHANKQVSRVVGLRESSTSSDSSFQKSLPWTSDSSSSGRLRNRFSMATKDSRASQKSTTSSDFSLPTSGTEYHSLPISPEPSAHGANPDLANISRSSITTLSELNEMMSKFTSSSENEPENVDKRKPAGRTSWSQYLSEGSLAKRDLASAATSHSSYSIQQSNVVIPRSGIHTALTTSGNSVRQWYRPTKTSVQSVGSAELDHPGFIYDKPSSQKQALDLFGDRSARTQLLQTLDLISDDSSNENSNVQSNEKEDIIPGISHKAFDEGQSSGTLISNADSSSISSSFPERQWVHLPKASAHSMGSAGLVTQVPTSGTQVRSTNQSSPVQRWVLPPKTSMQFRESAGNLNDIPSSGSQFSTGASVDSFSNWVLPPKSTTQTMGSASSMPSSAEHKWLSPPTSSTQSVGSTAPDIAGAGTEVSNVAQSSDTNRSPPLLQWLPPARASTQSVGSTAPDIASARTEVSNVAQSTDTNRSSPFFQWLPPARASTQSVGSTAPVADITSARTEVSNVAQSSDTNRSSPLLQWLPPARASTQSVRSTAHVAVIPSTGTEVSNVAQSLDTSRSSPVLQWLPPPKASTQSLGSDVPVSSSNNQVSNIYSSGSSSSAQQWFLPPKASIRTKNSLGVINKDENPVTNSVARSSSQWYPPTKASTQSLALQESQYGDSSPDQSVFTRESLPGNRSDATAETNSLPFINPGDGSDSSSTTDDVKIRLQNMGDVLLQLDKFLDAPSPTPSLSSGSIEHDDAQSQTDHSTVNSSTTTEMVTGPGPLQTAETSSKAETSKEEDLFIQKTESVTDSQSEMSESTSAPSIESDSVSLQDAFAQRKQDFVKKSLARVARAKEKRFEVKPRVHVKPREAKNETKKETKKKPLTKKKLPEK